MHTIIAWSESQDEAGVMTKMAGVPDQHVRVSGDSIYVSEYNQLIGAAALVGTTADEARLVSPSLRRVNPYYISPVTALLVPYTIPEFILKPQSPIPLDVNEALEAENDANPAAAEQHTVVALLAQGPITPVTGVIHTVNCHITVVLVAGAWAFSEITLPDALPVGNYDVVGARATVAAGVALRLVPVGAAHRPGGLTCAAVDDFVHPLQRNGGLGVWCTFNSVQPPGVEILSSAAAGSATYEVYLDVIKR